MHRVESFRQLFDAQQAGCRTLCDSQEVKVCIGGLGRVGRGWATGADWCGEPQARGARGFRGKRRLEFERARLQREMAASTRLLKGA